MANDTATETGSQTDDQVEDGYAVDSGTDSFTEGLGGSESVTDTATDGGSVTELGCSSNGSLSLSYHVFNRYDTSSSSLSDTGSSTESFNGLNQGSTYTGTDGGGFSDQDVQTSGDSVTEPPHSKSPDYRNVLSRKAPHAVF